MHSDIIENETVKKIYMMSLNQEIRNVFIRWEENSTIIKFYFIVNYFIALFSLGFFISYEPNLISLPFILFVYGIFIIFIGPISSIFLVTFILFLFYISSSIKYIEVAFGLVFMDINLIGINIIDLIINDWRVTLISIFILSIICLQSILFVRLSSFHRKNLSSGVIFSVISALLIPFSIDELADRQSADFKPEWVAGVSPSLATFLASVGAPPPELATDQRAAWGDGLASLRDGQRSNKSAFKRKVNIFVLLYESTFNPHYLDAHEFKVSESRILRPEKGASGPLIVPTFGGGTWLAEFALVTGQSPLAYGANAFYLNHLLGGRLKHGVIEGLLQNGFVARVIYPFPGNYMNAGEFYEGVGFDFIEPSKNERKNFWFRFDDDLLFERSLRELFFKRNNIHFVVTMANHGPHNVNEPYRQYMKTLNIQDEKLFSFVNEIEREFSDYENYFISFGDHQPFFTEKYIKNKENLYKTFWSIDCVGACPQMTEIKFPKKPIAVEFLLSVMISILDLPKGKLNYAHNQLLSEGCQSLASSCSIEDIHAFNWFFERYALGEGMH